jgi:hypothetical protein
MRRLLCKNKSNRHPMSIQVANAQTCSSGRLNARVRPLPQQARGKETKNLLMDQRNEAGGPRGTD